MWCLKVAARGHGKQLKTRAAPRHMMQRAPDWVRALPAMLLSALTGLLSALAYLALAPASYTARATLLLEPEANNPALIENQQAIIISDDILKRVAERLNLAKNAEFAAQVPRAKGGGSSATVDPAVEAALFLKARVRTSLVSQSTIIKVEATASLADQAALIAQGVAEAYLADLAASKTARAETATAARNKRLAALKDQVQLAQQLIETFHKANNSVRRAIS